MMLKKFRNLLLIFLVFQVIFLFTKCKKEENTDNEFPVIDFSGSESFPKSCDTILAGDFFNLKATFTDNAELSAYVIDIHHNFDHHVHKSSDSICDLSIEKDPFNPFVFIMLYEIPAGSVIFEASHLIQVPESIDTGDYHVYIRIADKRGYIATQSVGVKILSKEK